MLLEQYGATLDERLRRRIFQRAEDRVPYLYLEGEDASAAAVRGFQFLRECLVVDQTGELQHVRAGDGKAAEVHGGHVRSFVPDVAGSAAGSDERTRARHDLRHRRIWLMRLAGVP